MWLDSTGHTLSNTHYYKNTHTYFCEQTGLHPYTTCLYQTAAASSPTATFHCMTTVRSLRFAHLRTWE